MVPRSLYNEDSLAKLSYSSTYRIQIKTAPSERARRANEQCKHVENQQQMRDAQSICLHDLHPPLHGLHPPLQGLHPPDSHVKSEEV